MIKFRVATRLDLDKLYPDLKFSFRAIVAEENGKLLGIGGIYYDREWVIAFSKITPELKKHPIAIARGAKKIMKLIGDSPCIAFADKNYPGAPKLLERLGFVHWEGSVYKWGMCSKP